MPAVEREVAVAKAEEVVTGYGGERRSLIHVLQDVQAEFDYLPREALERISERMGIPLAEVLRVATFYRAFSLKPRGEHLVLVCTGTACHVKGAPRLLEAIRRTLALPEGSDTTEDMRFTVRCVRCLGCCGLAPVITVDGLAYGRLTPDRIPPILQEYG